MSKRGKRAGLQLEPVHRVLYSILPGDTALVSEAD